MMKGKFFGPLKWGIFGPKNITKLSIKKKWKAIFFMGLNFKFFRNKIFSALIFNIFGPKKFRPQFSIFRPKNFQYFLAKKRNMNGERQYFSAIVLLKGNSIFGPEDITKLSFWFLNWTEWPRATGPQKGPLGPQFADHSRHHGVRLAVDGP